MGLFGLFGSESESSSTSTSTTITKPSDERIGVEGGMYGTLVGPQAQVAETGGTAARVGDFGTLNQTITGNKYRIGMTGAEVSDLLQQQSLGFATAARSASDANERLSRLATTALSAETTGLPVDWTKIVVPIALIGGLVLILRRKA